jgi:hypothetical protein
MPIWIFHLVLVPSLALGPLAWFLLGVLVIYVSLMLFAWVPRKLHEGLDEWRELRRR